MNPGLLALRAFVSSLAFLTSDLKSLGSEEDWEEEEEDWGGGLLLPLLGERNCYFMRDIVYWIFLKHEKQKFVLCKIRKISELVEEQYCIFFLKLDIDQTWPHTINY